VVIITIVIHQEGGKYLAGRVLDINIVRIVDVDAMFRVLLINLSDAMRVLNQRPVLEKNTGFGQTVKKT
jgi:hypothetical protein